MNRRVIQESLNWIEAHLQAELTAQELADQAGFSLFHYYRIFHACTGMPVMQYIVRRRLEHAIFAVRNGEKRIDAALRYGFDTYAGFYRAFVREFGCTPTTYLKKNRAVQPVMVNILREESMRLTHLAAREALKNWKLENETITDWYYESSGRVAQQAVQVGEGLMLKRMRSKETMEKTCALAAQLHKAGAETNVLVADASGNAYVQLDGWYYCLFRQPSAKPALAADMYGPDSLANARYTGEIIGQLHGILLQAQLEARAGSLLEDVRGWALAQAKPLLKLPEEFWRSYLERFETLYPALPRQLIHRDLNPSVILRNTEGWGLMDFERAEENIRLFDPCYAATAVLSESFENAQKLDDWIGIYQNILAGYDSVVHLTQEEREAAPYVVLANQLVCVAWFANQPQYAQLAHTNCLMTRWLVERIEQLKL